MIDPDVAATACPDSPSSPNIIDPCPTSKASPDDAGDDPQGCGLSGAQDTTGSTSGTIDQSIFLRSHGAGKASVDAAQDDAGDGPRSSPNIAGEVHVAADDSRPLRRHGGCATPATDAFPSPAPAVSMTLEMHEKPSPRRSKSNVLSTNLLHSEAGDHGLTSCGSSKNSRGAHLSTVRCVRLSIGYRTEFKASASAGARYPLP